MMFCDLQIPESVYYFVDLICQWMISMSWQLVVIVAMLTILTWSLRNICSARFRYAIWLIVPIRLVIPPTLALAVGWGWWCLPSKPASDSVAINESSVAELDSRPELTGRSQNVAIASSDSEIQLNDRGQRQTTNGLFAVDGVSDHHPKNLVKGSTIEKPLGFPNKPNNRENLGQQTASPKSVDWQLPTASWPIVFFLVWLVGFGALLLRLYVGILQVRKLVHDSKPAADSTFESARICRELVGLKKPVAILTSLNVTTPMLVGIFRPTILLPVDCEKHLDAKELESVLVHEFQHVARRDPLVHLISTLISFAYWFHPAVWFTQWRLRQLRELACDEATIATLSNSRKSYASGLVKVAEMISSKQPSPAVGFIERKSEMTNRVMRILDRKTRIGRGVSAFGLIAIVTIGIVLIPGAARPAKSVPSTTRPSPTQTATENEIANTTQVAQRQEKEVEANRPPEELVVKIVDEKGKPLEGVNFFVSVSTTKLEVPSVVKENYKSNENGIGSLKLQTPLRSVRIWASKDGYAPLFFSWEDAEVKSIPNTYDLILQKGTKLSGIVVDSQDQPVSDAKVDVSLFGGGFKAEQKTRVRLDGWLAEGESRAITDENGKWSINNAPNGDDLDLRFMVEHPEFITDVARKTSEEYNVTLPQLRNGTAKFRLEKGISIRGKVTDEQGNPIQSGLVIWGDDPYHQEGSQEIEIGENGEYSIPPQPSGEFRLTVVAPGWMPVDRIFSLSADDTATQDFKLKRGKKLQLNFVDSEGKPVPKVYVGILEWHGKKHVLYNHAHPTIKSTKIPQMSNDQGVYTWDWAPDDLIKLSFVARDFGYSKEFEIVPNDVSKTFTIPSQFVLSGNVVDSVSGDPVTNFSIVPVKFSSDNDMTGSVEIRHTKTFQSTEFKFGNLNTAGNVKQVAFRFQADGYKEFMTNRFASDAPSLRTTIRLQPAATNSVRINNPDGEICTDAYAWLARPEQGTQTNSIEDYFSRSRGRQTVNPKGEFRYSPPSTKHAIVIANRFGYAEKYLEVDEDLEELTLQPWARLEGVVYQNGKPVPGARVQVVPIRQRGGSNPHVQDHFSATTDEDGRFEFEKLPPVPSHVRTHSSYPKDDPLLSNRHLPILLQPGGSHNISLGGGGQIVTGNVSLVGENPNGIQFQYGMNVLVKTDGGVQTPKHAREKIYFQTGAAKEWTDKHEADLDPNVTREKFSTEIREDGTFSFSGVQPGKYRLLARLYAPRTECLVDPIGYGFLEFSIEENQANENGVDLGDIEAKLEPVSKVGDLMPRFRYQDSTGRLRYISSYRGKFVLIDFWASWSQPSIKAFPDLAKIHDSIAKRDDAAIVSISVDEDFDAAKTIALREKLTWPVGVAGKSAVEGSAAKVLGVSAVPTYIVLDPNGKIVYRGMVLNEAATYLPNSKD